VTLDSSEELARLREQDELLDLVPDAVLVREARSGAIRYWNRGAERLYGWTREEATGSLYERLLKAEFPRPLAEIEAELVQMGQWAGYLVHVRRDGRRVAVASRWRLSGDKEGWPVYLEVNTARADRDSEVELVSALEAAAQYRGLLEAAPDAMVVVDASGQIELVNRQTEIMFGYQSEELHGRSVELLVPERFRAGHLAHRIGYKASPHTRPMGVGFDLCGRRKDGSEFPAEISLSPQNATGRAHVIAAIRDITQRKRVTTELERSNAELEQFAYTVSHDLKAPLVSIRGFAQHLADGYAARLDETGLYYVERIAANAERLTELIGDILAFSRISRVPPAATSVDVGQAIERILQDLVTPDLAATVRIRAPLPVVLANPSLIDQILRNLLTNAFTYGVTPGDAPDVEIGCEDRAGHWRLFVRDHGPGIPLDQQERVFGLFERLTAGKTVNPKGTGVGLSIVRKAAEAMGGQAGVDAGVGAGACFWVEVPKMLAAVGTPEAVRGGQKSSTSLEEGERSAEN
jgi:PAS domain S-box-containing protein